ncbi:MULTISPECIES: sulfite exporter TauE/SafE family protein [Flavobacterium]|uniref:Probable membrane transporter protein n=2 Tax=Flavobacterium TaxID=237 RepID=A0AA94JQI3_9FLAO|nr:MULTISPECIES: sulfite exporter TauE/SafE family protein [Flavobacterium]OXA82746.1 anion permease [Flavobacterium columnare] [Flavobacterium columnare NBRC 100251 = ATCC 23463]AMA49547.1 permease [Flavobacterium covae]AND63246.1 permease [Flavobacterium covae]MCH4828832.1 sulfite exporter TauE/SafE family protein [Flavobacterium columnare]MCH4832086.1 sulfite exporter TauE/SafE family protein [Flavobacterium columnare]
MNTITIIVLIITGLLAGMLSGLVGVGGGIIMVPMMVFILGFSQHQAQGTSLAVLVVPVTALAVFNYYKEGYINWKYAGVIALFFVVGSYAGSKLAVNLDQKMLKKVFSIILIVIGSKMFFEK